MRHRDAVAMFAGAGLAAPSPAIWADLGAGDGTFTLALADVLGPGSTIHAVDVDAAALRRLTRVSRIAHDTRIETHAGDFTAPWPFATPLDGILMANSLHYVDDKPPFLRACASHLAPSGRFLIVEYDISRANPWVPYPIAARALAPMFAALGFTACRMLGTRPSAYQRGQLYAAIVSRAAS